MPLPDLSTWNNARTALHQAAQILNMIRVADLDPLPNALRHSLQPTRTGATTRQLKSGITLTLDYTQGAIRVNHQTGNIAQIAINDHTQASLGTQVLTSLKQAGYTLLADQSKLTGTTLLTLDLDQGKVFAEVQWRMVQTLALVKSQLFGAQNPLVLWPHGFDLSTLWFAAGMDEHKDPHLNFGFSPGTPDIGQPYCYVYAWPLPAGLADSIQPPLQWHTAWSTPGAVLTYDRLVNESDPESVVVELLVAVYHRAADLLKLSAG